MTGFEQWEPLLPAVPDEPYSTSDADCPQCGAYMPSWCCYACGITEEEIAERLTGHSDGACRVAMWFRLLRD